MARKITVQLVGDSDSLEKAFDRAGRQGDKFGKQMTGMSSSLKGLAKAGIAGAAIGGVALLTKGLMSSVSAAKEAEVAEASLKQALKQSGNSFRRYGSEIDGAIQRTSKLAAIDDEELSASFSKLVRTSGDVTKATKGMALAADIARARNISLEAATKMVERALAGNESAFSRVGIASNKNKDSLDELERASRKYAGSAEAYGDTAAGAQEKLGVAFENLQEKLGEKLLPILTKVTLKLVEFIEWGERNWPKFSQKVSEMWAKVKPIFDTFRSYFDGWVKIIKGVIEGDWSLVWKGVKQVVANAFKLVYEYLKLVPLNLLKLGLRMGKALADGIIEGLGNIGERLANKIIPFGDPVGADPRYDALKARIAKAARQRDRRVPVGEALAASPRARGGPVKPGVPYIVGEHGPELRVFSRSGHIVPSGGGVTITGPIYVQGVQNVREFLAEIQRVAGHSSAQQRGRYGGVNLGLG